MGVLKVFADFFLGTSKKKETPVQRQRARLQKSLARDAVKNTEMLSNVQAEIKKLEAKLAQLKVDEGDLKVMVSGAAGVFVLPTKKNNNGKGGGNKCKECGNNAKQGHELCGGCANKAKQAA